MNQFTVVENKHERRPDVVLFVNGLPFAVIELKNPADEDATVWTAWQQLQTYKAELPGLFAMNAALIGVRRCRSANRYAHVRPGVVQALADDLGRDLGRSPPAAVAGAGRRRM